MATTTPIKQMLTVQATKLCYFGFKRRREGNVFKVRADLFSPNCMKLVSGDLLPATQAKFGLDAKGRPADDVVAPVLPAPVAAPAVLPAPQVAQPPVVSDNAETSDQDEGLPVKNSETDEFDGDEAESGESAPQAPAASGSSANQEVL